MKLYNTLSRSLEEFVPADNHTVKLYTCGPTVYDFLTIGNWVAYVRWDILARVLRSHWELNWYTNITDVGHLVSDADEGQDKLEKGAQREGKTAWEVADFYTADFVAGLEELNSTMPPDHLVKATDHIPEQIDLIKTLETKGYTYQTSDGVYFDSTKFADYGKLAKLDIQGLEAGARVEVGEKHHPTDFALWKFSPKNEHRDMEWESPWGKGFPGWHIECSAMAMKYLGHTLDIHAGGIDHIPVHHTNEIAQSEAATGEQFSRFWIHGNFLNIEGEKIAKSAGNGYTLADLAAKGYDGQVIRLFVLQSHYRTHSNFTFDTIEATKQRLSRWRELADLRWQLIPDLADDQTSILSGATAEIIDHLNNDLDTPKALAAIEKGFAVIANGIAISAEPSLRKFLETINDMLGINLLSGADISDNQRARIHERQHARVAQDWVKADELRDELAAEGLALRDLPDRILWSRSVK